MALRLAICLLVAALLSGPAYAVLDTWSQQCDAAALAAAVDQDIPPQVMLAITRAETGRQTPDALAPWPWTINIAGQGHWFDSMDEAIAFASQAIAEGVTNMDIGCFQINLRWHAENFSSLDHMFDPFENAHYAAVFLRKNYQKVGNWVDAVAAYHSSNPEFAAPYIERVEAILKNLEMPEPNTKPPEMVRENHFPLLQAGGVRSKGSLVPLGGGATTPLIVAMP